ncbi:unnamed protein product [Diamesa hyperborea]
MWKCNKCQKPVFFAERKQSLGYDWHPECLRCEECGKRLNPGQHAEHKGVPYCHVPCYGALFGPQLFGHGTRVESHKSFGQKSAIVQSPKASPGPQLPRSHIESKLKVYNQFYNNRSLEIRARELNDRLVLEGTLRIYWGIQGVIHLKEDDDQRTVVTIRKRNSVRYPNSVDIVTSDNDTTISESLSYDTLSISSDLNSDMSSNSSSKESSPAHKSSTLPSKLNIKSIEWDEIDELLQVERKLDEADRVYQTMPSHMPSRTSENSLTDISQGSTTDGSTSASYKTLTQDNYTLNMLKNSSSSSSSEDKTLKHESNRNRSALLKKSVSMQTTSSSNESPGDDNDSWAADKGLLRSKSGPNYAINSVSDFESDTMKLDERQFEDECDADADIAGFVNGDGVVLRKKPKGSTAIKRRAGNRRSRTKLKRRCSINGHFYNRETSFFTPPKGSQMSVYVTSLLSTQEIISLVMEKYKVESKAENFALFIVRDNGEQKKLSNEDFPLLVRILIGPHEDVARLFLMDAQVTEEISPEVAQFLNLSIPECRSIVERYYEEEERELFRIREKYADYRRRIVQRMESLKVRL